MDAQILIKLRPGADLHRAEGAAKAAAASYGKPHVQDLAEYRASVTSGVNTILGLVYVMLALAIIIALMGIANTLTLSIHERTRELGLLRAVGQSRRQTRAMIRWESVLIAVFGTIGGALLGLFLGWALVTASSTCGARGVLRAARAVGDLPGRGSDRGRAGRYPAGAPGRAPGHPHRPGRGLTSGRDVISVSDPGPGRAGV